MHLVIISGATRPQVRSNTAKILAAFQRGFEQSGNTAEIWYLSDRRQWSGARAAFETNEHILFALPLYVENIPGSMLEFLTTLTPKNTVGMTIAFLVQGGFPEPSQARCCERFLEKLPQKLGCTYAGTLTKGDMFGVGLLPRKLSAQLIAPFEGMGRRFAEVGVFNAETARAFAGPETLSAKQMRRFNHIGRPMQKLMMGKIAKKLGCKTRLDARPYGLSGKTMD